MSDQTFDLVVGVVRESLLNGGPTAVANLLGQIVLSVGTNVVSSGLYDKVKKVPTSNQEEVLGFLRDIWSQREAHSAALEALEARFRAFDPAARETGAGLARSPMGHTNIAVTLVWDCWRSHPVGPRDLTVGSAVMRLTDLTDYCGYVDGTVWRLEQTPKGFAGAIRTGVTDRLLPTAAPLTWRSQAWLPGEASVFGASAPTADGVEEFKNVRWLGDRSKFMWELSANGLGRYSQSDGAGGVHSRADIYHRPLPDPAPEGVPDLVFPPNSPFLRQYARRLSIAGGCTSVSPDQMSELVRAIADGR